jgi:hypothetical protein
MDRKIKEDQLQFYQMGRSLLVGLVSSVFLLDISLILIRYKIPQKRIALSYDYNR